MEKRKSISNKVKSFAEGILISAGVSLSIANAGSYLNTSLKFGGLDTPQKKYEFAQKVQNDYVNSNLIYQIFNVGSCLKAHNEILDLKEGEKN